MLSVCGELPSKWNNYLASLSIQQKRINVSDDVSSNLIIYFEECIKFIDEGRGKGSVFVHCWQGVSRSSTIVICYLMYKMKISSKEAYSIVKNIRPKVNPNQYFQKCLLEYEKEIFQEDSEKENSKENSENKINTS